MNDATMRNDKKNQSRTLTLQRPLPFLPVRGFQLKGASQHTAVMMGCGTRMIRPSLPVLTIF
jgi:hypothetical protein